MTWGHAEIITRFPFSTEARPEADGLIRNTPVVKTITPDSDWPECVDFMTSETYDTSILVPFVAVPIATDQRGL